MDRQIENKDKPIKKYLIILLPTLIIVGMITKIIAQKPTLGVDQNTVMIKEVIKGKFEDFVLLDAIVVARHSILLNVIEGGSVSEIFQENGSIVEEGDMLIRIYNPVTELNYMTQETAIVEQINNLLNIRINLKNQQLLLTEQELGIDNSYQNALRAYQIDTGLYKKGVVSKVEYDNSIQEFSYQKKRNELVRTNVTVEKGERKEQLNRINESIENMERNLEMLKKNKAHFIIRAPAKGMLSSFNPVLGASYLTGESVGALDMLSGYKLIVKADEFYLSKLTEGANGTVLIEKKEYKVKIDKIQPNVEGGQFEIELNFLDEVAAQVLNAGMTLKSRIQVKKGTEALLVGKGLFYQDTRGKWAYVLSEDGYAHKKSITIGRENPYYYEVLAGLSEGDRIITSGYEDYNETETIKLK